MTKTRQIIPPAPESFRSSSGIASSICISQAAHPPTPSSRAAQQRGDPVPLPPSLSGLLHTFGVRNDHSGGVIGLLHPCNSQQWRFRFREPYHAHFHLRELLIHPRLRELRSSVATQHPCHHHFLGCFTPSVFAMTAAAVLPNYSIPAIHNDGVSVIANHAGNRTITIRIKTLPSHLPCR